MYEYIIKALQELSDGVLQCRTKAILDGDTVLADGFDYTRNGIDLSIFIIKQTEERELQSMFNDMEEHYGSK